MEKPEKVQKQLCAIYTRVSSSEQLTSDFTSLDNQREYADNYIKSQGSLGWEIYPERYDDPGYTGGNMERPGLQKLMGDVKRGKFNIIVIYKIDRLTRSLRDFGKLWEIFEQYNVSFVSVTQKFDTTTSMGRLMLHILLSFAQFEREVNSERTRDKRMASAKRGKWLGGYPVVGFDLNRETKKIETNKNETKQVEFMFKNYLQEQSALKASHVINATGYRTKAWITKRGRHMGGREFTKNALKDHLRNPIYIGKIRYKGDLYEGEHSAIISEELFNQAQSLLNRNGRKKNTPYKTLCHNFLLTGLLRCVYCGSMMTASPSKSRNGNYFLYYRCTKVIKNDKSACKLRHLPARELENMVLGRIKHLANSPDILNIMIKKAQSSATTTLPGLQKELTSKVKMNSGLENDIRNMKKCIKENLNKKKNVDFLIEECNESIQRQNKSNKEIEQLKIKIDKIKNRIISAESIRCNLNRFSDVFNELEYAEKRELLNLLLREIRVDGEKAKIELDLYPLPDIDLYIKKGIRFGPRMPRLPTLDGKLTSDIDAITLLVRMYKYRGKGIKVVFGEPLPPTPAPPPKPARKNIAAKALKVQNFLAEDSCRTYIHASQEFNITKARVCQLMKIVNGLPLDFLEKMRKCDDQSVLKSFSGKKLLKLANYKTKKEQTHEIEALNSRF